VNQVNQQKKAPSFLDNSPSAKSMLGKSGKRSSSKSPSNKAPFL